MFISGSVAAAVPAPDTGAIRGTVGNAATRAFLQGAAVRVLGTPLVAFTEGDGTWAELLPNHMRTPPVNAWVRPENSKKVVIGDSADDAWQGDYAWIYDPATGNVYAGGFSAQDQPFPRE